MQAEVWKEVLAILEESPRGERDTAPSDDIIPFDAPLIW
jgi:hypothetical protein